MGDVISLAFGNEGITARNSPRESTTSSFAFWSSESIVSFGGYATSLNRLFFLAKQQQILVACHRPGWANLFASPSQQIPAAQG